MNLKKFLTDFCRSFGAPGLPDGFVNLVEFHDGTFEIIIGERAIYIEADGSIPYSGENYGVAWMIRSKSALEQLAEIAEE